MSRQSKLALLLVVGLIVPMLTLDSTPSSADPIPPTQWPPINLSDMTYASNVISHLDGDATVGCIDGNDTTAFKTFSPTGMMVQSRPTSTAPQPTTCAQRSAVGKDGRLFTFARHQYTPAFQTYQNNNLIWEYQPNCGNNLYPYGVVVGPNGNLYALTIQGSSGNGCSSVMLIGLSAEAQSGSPNVLFKVPVYGNVTPGGLAVYENGLVVNAHTEIQFYSFTGVLLSSIPFTMASASFGYGERFDATLSGRVFVANKANPGAATGCVSPDNVAGSISAIQDNGPAWTAILTGCSYVYDLRPTYWGGVVMHAMWRDETGGDIANKLVAFDKQGNVLWWQLFNQANQDMRIAVDLNGNVAVRRNTMVRKFLSGSYYNFPEIQFSLLSGITGEELAELALRGDNSNTNGPSYLWTDSEARIGKGVAYILAKDCTSFPYCQANSTKLYAISIPGLEIDYPRGAILRADEPWLNYVAMGDSFSSGEGVEPFLDGTNVSNPPNLCHRSEKAYGKLLDGNPALRLNLAEFVACSGAFTNQIVEPWPDSAGESRNRNELAQISMLNSFTKRITLTIGGNDIGFERFVTQCLFLDCSIDNQQFFNKIEELGDKLSSIYDTILAAAPNATVYVVGYPQILPNPSICPNPLDAGVAILNTVVGMAHAGDNAAVATVYLVGQSAKLSDSQIQTLISAGEVTFTATEIETARQLTTGLNNRISQVITGKLSPRLRMIAATNTGSPFYGHELCTSNPFFNGLDLVNPVYSFHPNKKGQNAYARLIVDFLS